MAAATTIEASSSWRVAISNRLHLSRVNPDLTKDVLQEQLRALFSRFGTVQEVFLSTRCQNHYGFVVMETREEAQQALDGLHNRQYHDGNSTLLSSSFLFQSVDAADDFLPRNKKARRIREHSLQDYRDRHHLALSSNMICQVHKSHQKRFEDFLTSQNRSNSRTVVELVGSFIPATERTKNVALVFVKTTIVDCGPDKTCEAGQDDPTSDLTNWLWSKWYLESVIHRITVWDRSIPLGSGVLQGSLSGALVPAIYKSIRENLLMETHGKESAVEIASIDGMVKNSAITFNDSVLVRLAVFPPKLQQPLLNALEEQWELSLLPMGSESEQSTVGLNNDTAGIPKVRFSPTNATHTLAIVMLHEGVTDTEKEQEIQHGSSTKLLPLPPQTDTDALYVIGRLERIVPADGTSVAVEQKDDRPTFSETYRSISGSGNDLNNNYNRNDNTKNASNDSISRAYWKLQEAWERYRYGPPTKGLRIDRSISGQTGILGIRALDCGSSPGGWTKFLYDRYHCQIIYSVDPGHLDAHVLELDPLVIRHMPCTIQQAFPQLGKDRDQLKPDGPGKYSSVSDKGDDGGPFLDIWVSDMCVKDMPAQVDLFLEALHMGLVGPGTFFVLTMKCVLGHSHATFDRVVQVQVDRLIGRPSAAPELAKNVAFETMDVVSGAKSSTVGCAEWESCCSCRDVQVLHLFANRSSERTIVGYLT